VGEQTTLALDKIRLALAEAGSDLNHIVKTTVYLTNMDNLPRFEEALRAYFRQYARALAEDPPAATIVGVCSLSEPDMAVEIEAIAVLLSSFPEPPL
jgi:2-iminobutanoate/2-iminopropanoate deaminase